MSAHPEPDRVPLLKRFLGLVLLAVVLCGPWAGKALFAAQGHGNPAAGEAEHGAGAQLGESGGATDEHGSTDKKQMFLGQYRHVVPHPIGIAFLDDIGFRNFNLFQVIALVLMFGIFAWVRNGLVASLQGKGSLNAVQRVFAGFVMFIRDEMVRPIMGDEDAKKFTPYFLFVFFFIAFQNLLGLIPGGSTATASILVTAALALTTLSIMIVGGMVVQGPLRFWTSLVPHGLPAAMWPLMFVVELIGVFVKPFALMIRLFANMTAGHLVVLSFIGLIFYFGGMLGGLGYAVAVPLVGMGVFIMIIEGFVALLQAYIFTYLSILFVRMYLHPEH